MTNNFNKFLLVALVVGPFTNFSSAFSEEDRSIFDNTIPLTIEDKQFVKIKVEELASKARIGTGNALRQAGDALTGDNGNTSTTNSVPTMPNNATTTTAVDVVPVDVVPAVDVVDMAHSPIANQTVENNDSTVSTDAATKTLAVKESLRNRLHGQWLKWKKASCETCKQAGDFVRKNPKLVYGSAAAAVVTVAVGVYLYKKHQKRKAACNQTK